MKTCTKCNANKPLSDFFKDKTRKDGYMYTCKSCRSSYVEANKDKVLECIKRWRAENPDKARKASRTWGDKNPAKRNASNKAWNKANYHKMRPTRVAWLKANSQKVAAWASRKRAVRLKATPGWADSFIIEEIYDLAKLRTKSTGVVWHVDHIVPLCSKLVCGLHVENNLRVILGHENHRKSNRHWPDMPVDIHEVCV